MSQQGEGTKRSNGLALHTVCLGRPSAARQPSAVPQVSAKKDIETLCLSPEVPQGEIELSKPFYLIKASIQEIVYNPSSYIT